MAGSFREERTLDEDASRANAQGDQTKAARRIPDVGTRRAISMLRHHPACRPNGSALEYVD